MADFLSDQWFTELNARLSHASPGALPEAGRPCRLVFEITDVAPGRPSAITFTIADDSLRVSPGEVAPADAVLRLSHDDAAALASGQLDSANALRDGRIKVRGDVNVIVPLTNWLHAVLDD